MLRIAVTAGVLLVLLPFATGFTEAQTTTEISKIPESFFETTVFTPQEAEPSLASESSPLSSSESLKIGTSAAGIFELLLTTPGLEPAETVGSEAAQLSDSTPFSDLVANQQKDQVATPTVLPQAGETVVDTSNPDESNPDESGDSAGDENVDEAEIQEEMNEYLQASTQKEVSPPQVIAREYHLAKDPEFGCTIAPFSIILRPETPVFTHIGFTGKTLATSVIELGDVPKGVQVKLGSVDADELMIAHSAMSIPLSFSLSSEAQTGSFTLPLFVTEVATNQTTLCQLNLTISP